MEEFTETENATHSVIFGDWGASDQGLVSGIPLLNCVF